MRRPSGTLRYYQRLDANSISSLATTIEDDNPFRHVNETGVRQLQMADWNGDGRTDLLLLRGGLDILLEVVRWEQLQSGGIVRREAIVSATYRPSGCHFQRPNSWNSDSAQAFGVVDYNGDGRLDFVGKRTMHDARTGDTGVRAHASRHVGEQDDVVFLPGLQIPEFHSCHSPGCSRLEFRLGF